MALSRLICPTIGDSLAAVALLWRLFNYTSPVTSHPLHSFTQIILFFSIFFYLFKELGLLIHFIISSNELIIKIGLQCNKEITSRKIYYVHLDK